MPMTTSQPTARCQADPALTQSPTDLLSEGTKVVVIDAGIEIHGYEVARKGNRVRVLWAVASGRHRHRTFSDKTVFQPDNPGSWDGYPIHDDQLAAIRQAAR